MYSPSYKNGGLKDEMPFHRLQPNGTEYRVIAADLGSDHMPTGLLLTKNVPVADYVADTVAKLEGLLKFSIVKISPFVLTAEEFNTQLGNVEDGKVTLFFDKETTVENYFSHKLHAQESANLTARQLGYLNIEVYNDAGQLEGYMANMNKNGTFDEPYNSIKKYNNNNGDLFLNIAPQKKKRDRYAERYSC
jgi:hypothetical protein